MSGIVHLARHGETLWHAENRYAGSSDVPLADRGRRQAEGLATWAESARLDRIRVSDLTRARETANVVAARVGLPVVVDARLREIDFGAAEGLTSTEMDERFPEARRAFLAAPATHPLPGGEAGEAAAQRMLAGLLDALDGADGPVLVVAHTTVIRLALCLLLGLPLDRYREAFPELLNAAVTSLRLPSGQPVGRAALLTLNRPTP